MHAQGHTCGAVQVAVLLAQDHPASAVLSCDDGLAVALELSNGSQFIIHEMTTLS